MNATAIVLFVVGASLELVGIILVGSPDFFPQAARVSRWLRVRFSVFASRVLRLLGRPRHHAVSIDSAISVGTALGASAFVSISEGASVEEKVAYLLRRHEEAQNRFNDLHARVASIEQGLPKRLEELRHESKQYVADALAAAHNVYLPLRLLGAGLVVVGLGCATAGNFF